MGRPAAGPPAELQPRRSLRDAEQVRVLGGCLGQPEKACLIMELVEGGDLASRIHDRRKRRLTYLQILQVPGTLGTRLHIVAYSWCLLLPHYDIRTRPLPYTS